jgi:hypothetical protein
VSGRVDAISPPVAAVAVLVCRVSTGTSHSGSASARVGARVRVVIVPSAGNLRSGHCDGYRKYELGKLGKLG